MGLDYVDIFYSHRFDPDTPLHETLGALDRLDFSAEELEEIDRHAVDSGINLWAESSEA
jgi:hypothetical protein